MCKKCIDSSHFPTYVRNSIVRVSQHNEGTSGLKVPTAFFVLICSDIVESWGDR
uniref:Uncharacterized protein n=1 Tax=Arundo donax TaxID=35708 RepID=A0A0A9BSZ9_ARUDO